MQKSLPLRGAQPFSAQRRFRGVAACCDLYCARLNCSAAAGDFAAPPVGLADGYRVEARIVVWEVDGVVKIASTAVFRRAELAAFFLEDLPLPSSPSPSQ